MKRNQLSVQFVRSVTQPGRYGDGMGLMLNVKQTGSKSWVQRLVVQGKRRDIGLGSALRVSLAEARKIAFKNWCEARGGGDPTRQAGTVPTFEAALDIVIAIHREGWKHAGKSEAQWRASLRDYAMARIGARPVDQITSADVLAVLVPIWSTKRETARRVRGRISSVMQWAIAEGYRSDDPAGDPIRAALPRNGAVKRHQRALPYQDVSDALAALQATTAAPTTLLALEFLILTAARSGEVRRATWTEVDLDAAVWTVPATRMKQKREHRVPLSSRALEILREAGPGHGTDLIFPSATGRTMSDGTLSKLLRDNGVECVPHGFRSSFRDWSAEKSNVPGEIAEMALAHVNSNKVEAAYRRTDLFEARRDLMQRWADYLDRDATGKVIPIHG